MPFFQASLCKEDSPIRGNVVEDDKRVAWLVFAEGKRLRDCF